MAKAVTIGNGVKTVADDRRLVKIDWMQREVTGKGNRRTNRWTDRAIDGRTDLPTDQPTVAPT